MGRWRGKAAAGDRDKRESDGTNRDPGRRVKTETQGGGSRGTDQQAQQATDTWGVGAWASPGRGSKRQKETPREKKDTWRLKGRDLETERGTEA